MASTTPDRYDAFISYNHGADIALAPHIKRTLEQLGKSWRARRALRVFRDESNLGYGANLSTELRKKLDESDYLVFLASPGAARSEKVGEELEHWIATNRSEHLLIVVTDGTAEWDDHAADFAWSSPDKVTAVPPMLRGAFTESPLSANLSWIKADKVDLSTLGPQHPKFRSEIARVAARIHGKDPEDVVSEDLRQHARATAIRRTAVVVLALLTATAVALGSVATASRRTAIQQRDRAEQENRRNLAQSLASKATFATDELPDLRLLTAVAADRIDSTPATQGALLRTMLDLPDTNLLLPGHSGAVIDLQIAGDGSRLATVDAAGAVRIWSASDGKLLGGPLAVEATEVLISETGEVVVSVDRAGLIRWFDGEDGREQRQDEPPEGASFGFGCDAWGCARPLAGISPDGSTVALAANLGDGRHVVRFTGDGSEPVEVELNDQVTGLLWHSSGRLFVSDLTGIQEWDGADGPTTGRYGYVFSAGAGMLPGGAAFVDGGSLNSVLDGPVLAIVTGGVAGDPSVVDFLEITDDGQWRSNGGLTADAFGESSIGAIAALDAGVVVVGTDPQLGGDAVPQAIVLEADNDRTLLGRWNLPSGAITRIAVSPTGAIAIAGLDPIVRINGIGQGIAEATTTEIGDAPFVFDPGTVGEALPAVVDGADLIVGIGDSTTGLAAGIYSDTEPEFLSPNDVRSGAIRIVDEEGADVTPDALSYLEATGVAFDADHEHLLIATASGRIDRYRITDGEIVDGGKVLEAPISSVASSPDGRFLVAVTPTEIALVDPTTFVVIKTLVASTASLAEARSLYVVPDVRPVQGGFDDDGDFWFGWSSSAAELMGVLEPSAENGPFGNDELLVDPWLPGSGPGGVGRDSSIHLQLADLAGRACSIANRELTGAEWQQLAGTAKRVELCPDRPEPVTVAERLERQPSDDRDETTTAPSGTDPTVDGDRPSTSATPVDAFEAFLRGEGALSDNDYTGECTDVDEAGLPPTGTSCLIVLSLGESDATAVEVSESVIRLVHVEGPAPWAVTGTWIQGSGEPMPDWASKVWAG